MKVFITAISVENYYISYINKSFTKKLFSPGILAPGWLVEPPLHY